MTVAQHHRDGYVISTDKESLDLDLVHDFLSRSSYWAQGRPFAAVQRSVEHSLSFGVYADAGQVGFARVVTDYATFGWLCDVFILDSHRGQGLGKWLVESIVAHPDVQELTIFLLATRDAHELYRRRGGFEVLETPEGWMTRIVKSREPSQTAWQTA